MSRFGAAFVIAALAACSAGAVQRHYVVTWADGTSSTAAEIDQWGTATARPSLRGHELFDAKNPARVIVEEGLPRREPEPPYVELQSGERLGGRVVAIREPDEAGGLPAHLVVEPHLEFELPGVFPRPQVRVIASAVRRIVLAQPPASAPALKPNEVRTAGGEVQPFRAIGWRTDSLELLTAAGVKHVELANLAAIELARHDAWQTWLARLAVLSPGLDAPLVEMELSDGSRLTTSRERLRPVTVGGEGPEHWFHLCQPAWSLDLLAVPHRQVRRRVVIDSGQTPLTALPLSASRGQGLVTGAPTPSRLDASLAGGPLLAKGHEAAWGVAVHAPHELVFELPASARRLRTRLALDHAVGSGGCARGQIEQQGKKLYESPLLIGSGKVLESGSVPVAPGPLALIADPAAHDPPRGADPLDIRDELNWLEPLVEHDPSALRRAVQKSYPAAHPVLAHFTPDPAEAGNWRLVGRFDESDSHACGFRTLLALDGPLTITRRIPLAAPTGVLRVTLGRSIPAEGATLDLWIDGNRVHRQTLPALTEPAEPLRIEVPLRQPDAAAVTLTLRVAPAGKSTLIDLRGLHLDHGEGITANR